MRFLSRFGVEWFSASETTSETILNAHWYLS